MGTRFAGFQNFRLADRQLHFGRQCTSVQTFRKVLKNNNITGKIFSKGYWLEGKTGL